MEVDAPKAQDLGKVLAEIRAQYDALAQKNLEDLEKQWGQQVRAPPGRGGVGGAQRGAPGGPPVVPVPVWCWGRSPQGCSHPWGGGFT